jgi:phosphatidyl-myo-inositol dimannoside synthase
VTRRHLLVTNDFPPKVGGIQSYLWELWRRLPPESFAVYTTPHRGAAAFDAAQPFTVIRSPEPWLGPYPWLARRVDRIADEHDADLVLLDPALPLGHIGPSLRHPYGVVLHGAEVTIPGRLPVSAQLLARVLDRAVLVIAAGGYPAAEGERAAGRRLPTVVVPPGVDVDRFAPLDQEGKSKARAELGLPSAGPLVVSVSRLVPRKGMDTLVRAAARLRHDFPSLTVAVAGSGRERPRLERLASDTGAPVRFLGRVADDDLPALYGGADVFAMLCRTRWLGLEQEGFGIVFVEAAAAGVPQVAGASGGAAEAVAHGETGLVVAAPKDPAAVAEAIGALLADPTRRADMAVAARQRAEVEFAYDVLAARLASALAGAVVP